MVAEPAAPALTVSDTDRAQVKQIYVQLSRLTGVDHLDPFCPTHQLYKCFCGGDSPESQPVIIEQEPMDNTFSQPEVATSFEQQLEAVNTDKDQELKTKSELKINISNKDVLDRKLHLHQDLQHKLFPFPVEGVVCLSQWKYFLAAFESHYLSVWVVHTNNHVFMAATVRNVTPTVSEAISVLDIRYALDHDELPLLAVQLLRSEWQNYNTNNHIMGLQGMQGYWHIKRLKSNLSRKASSKISPFLLISRRGEMSGAVQEEPPQMLQLDGTGSSSGPEIEPNPRLALDASISISNVRDCLAEKRAREEDLPSTAEIFEQSQEINVDTDNLDHAQPAKILRLEESHPTSSNTTTPGAKSNTKLDYTPNQQGVNDGNKITNSRTIPILKYPATPKIKSVTIERPNSAVKIYPKSNIPAQGNTTPVKASETVENERILSKSGKPLTVNINGKVIRLEQATPWSPFLPASANVSQNKELQNNGRVNIGRKRPLSEIVQPQTSNALPNSTTPQSFSVFKKYAPPKSAPVCQPQQPAVAAPRGVFKIYPIPNMPVNNQSMQNQIKPTITPSVSTTKIPAAVTGLSSSIGTRQDQPVASPEASVPIHGYIYANKLPAYPAKLQASYFIIKLPEVEAIVFKSLTDVNRFFNNYLTTNPEFKERLPAEWKFLNQN
ncbi:uncharacterized protein LOC110177808 [Drosophila serrata]|uniref:uncharacterized protein LOC110177808 n=1 Tax=Drosophila serrata TaxID=7274 RepID=UPI000A1CF5EA|nr:uncharacterized protein LOC110177808 [Drosophila serrata]